MGKAIINKTTNSIELNKIIFSIKKQYKLNERNIGYQI